MIREMRTKWLWTNWTIVSLGLWLTLSAFSLGDERPNQTLNDVVCGLLLAGFAVLALVPRYDTIGRWTVAVIGTWLQAAPLVFWAKNPASYFNDTLVGAIAIALSILVPMMPGMAHHHEMMKPGATTPPGWSYNPSSWPQRAPLIALALLGWLVSRLLTAFQLGYAPTIWEPFFGEGTVRVLTSEVSRSFPISDAGLGAFAYTFELLMAWMGKPERWRTMPWMVSFFFILVVPLGLVHITLVVLQPVMVGAWCTLCLLAAFLMLLMIPLAVDEVVATGQFLRRAVRTGKPFWRTFIIGGTTDEVNEDDRVPHYGAPVRALVRAGWWGVSLPWTLLASAAVGVWLMVSPAVFQTDGIAADLDHVLGAVIVTVAVVCTAEVIRVGRYFNVVAGLAIAAAPWLAGYFGPATGWNDLVCGLVVIALSLPRGPVRERYGSWSPLVR